MMRKFLILTLLIVFPITAKETDYPHNPYVTDAVWETVKPYFLPYDHPIRPKLDRLFARRPTINERTVKKAGFNSPKKRPQSHMVISTHKAIPGYWFKMFTDDQKGVVDYTHMIHRIKGARSIQRTIERRGYEHLFKVPKKWIYPLPAEPSPPTPNRMNFVLIAEDMKTLSRKSNNHKWKSSAMTKERATALYIVMKVNGLRDSIYPFNIPFSRDGKMAFIDTEYHHAGPVHFDRMLHYMPHRLRNFWQYLTHGQNNGQNQ
ncbi:MAG: hypothetical protein LLG04_00700, partial [Parachlamydia sp.]|nr:hypothetical protein [Parachlamydia sp.]